MEAKEHIWKEVRTEFCAHYIDKENNGLHLHIIPSSANLESYHVIQEVDNDDTTVDYSNLTKNEIRDTFSINI